jgi:hypothetical protein
MVLMLLSILGGGICNDFICLLIVVLLLYILRRGG